MKNTTNNTAKAADEARKEYTAIVERLSELTYRRAVDFAGRYSIHFDIHAEVSSTDGIRIRYHLSSKVPGSYRQRTVRIHLGRDINDDTGEFVEAPVTELSAGGLPLTLTNEDTAEAKADRLTTALYAKLAEALPEIDHVLRNTNFSRLDEAYEAAYNALQAATL